MELKYFIIISLFILIALPNEWKMLGIIVLAYYLWEKHEKESFNKLSITQYGDLEHVDDVLWKELNNAVNDFNYTLYILDNLINSLNPNYTDIQDYFNMLVNKKGPIINSLHYFTVGNDFNYFHSVIEKMIDETENEMNRILEFYRFKINSLR